MVRNLSLIAEGPMRKIFLQETYQIARSLNNNKPDKTLF